MSTRPFLKLIQRIVFGFIVLQWIEVSASGAVFLVTNNLDSGSGSLRQALSDANARPGLDEVAFALPHAQLKIAPSSPLPDITDPVVIDATTQLGYAGKPVVELTGRSAQGVGFMILGGGTTIRGLAMNGFAPRSIHILGGGTNVVESNFIGPDVSGNRPVSTELSGILIEESAFNRVGNTDRSRGNLISGNSFGLRILGSSASNNVVVGNIIGLWSDGSSSAQVSGISVRAPHNEIGSRVPGAGNVISGNREYGVALWEGSDGSRVIGNWIGADPAGGKPIENLVGIRIRGGRSVQIGGASSGEGNIIAGGTALVEIQEQQGFPLSPRILGNRMYRGTVGIDVLSGSEIAIGGTSPGEGNIIEACDRAGIQLGTTVSRVTFRGNSIFAHSTEAVAFFRSVGTPNLGTTNDFLDLDSGPNGRLNHPELLSARFEDDVISASGRYQGAPNQVFTVDLYANRSLGTSTLGEGELFLGTTTVETDDRGTGVWSLRVDGNLRGRYLAATATDHLGNTSRFGPWFAAEGDRAPKVFLVTTRADAGPGSLRQAILDANGWLSSQPDQIRFEIPGRQIQSMQLKSPLPTLSDPVIIDGFSQDGSRSSNDSELDNSRLLIRLDGQAHSASILTVETDNVLIRGLCFAAWTGGGILIQRGMSNAVEGCYFGLEPDRATPGKSPQHAVLIQSGRTWGNRIGGFGPASRNWIRSSRIAVRVQSSSLNVIVGNRIMSEVDTSSVGVWIEKANSLSNRVVGAVGALQQISSKGDGILDSGEYTHFEGNLISPARNGMVLSGRFARLKAASPELANRIQWYSSSGILVAGASNVIQGSIIDGSGEYGILVRSDGNLIGGSQPSQGNQMSGNTRAGVGISVGVGNLISGNRIYSNPGLGISLNADASGVGIPVPTPNDDADEDAGSNDRMNFPVLDEVTRDREFIHVRGTVRTRPLTSVVVELFQSEARHVSGVGEGQYFLGRLETQADAQGLASFEGVFRSPELMGSWLSATATDGAGNTSEFCVAAEVIWLEELMRSRLTLRIESASGDYFQPGFPANYTLVVKNEGPDIARSVWLTNQLPANVDVSYFAASTGTVERHGDVLVCFVPSLPVGSDLRLLVEVVPGDVASFTTVASVGSAGVKEPGEGGAIVLTVNQGFPDLTFGAEFNAVEPRIAGYASFTVAVTNVGKLTGLHSQLSISFPTNVLAADFFVVGDETRRLISGGLGGITTKIGSITPGQALRFTFFFRPGQSGAAKFAVSVYESAQNLKTREYSEDAWVPVESSFLGFVEDTLTASNTERPLEIPIIRRGNTNSRVSIVAEGFAPTPNLSVGMRVVHQELVFTPGETLQLLKVDLSGIDQHDRPRSLSLRLSNPTGLAYLGEIDRCRVRIVRDAPQPPRLVLVSSKAGAPLIPSSGFAAIPVLSADGRHVAFFTTATDLTETAPDVSMPGAVRGFVRHDLLTGRSEWMGGISFWMSTNSDSFNLSTLFLWHRMGISANGQRVLIQYEFSKDGNAQTYSSRFLPLLHDAGSSSPFIGVVRNTGGAAPNAGVLPSQLSRDGKALLFTTAATDVMPLPDVGDVEDLFLRDLVSGETELITRTSSGDSAPIPGLVRLRLPMFSDDSRSVLFETQADYLVSEDTNHLTDVYVYDRSKRSNELVSRSFDGSGPANQACTLGDVTPEGRYVAFSSSADNLVVGDNNGKRDVFVRDRVTQRSTMVSLNYQGTGPGNGDSSEPSLSADGRYVVFVSEASDLVTNDFNGAGDVFLRDLSLGVTQLISRSHSEDQSAAGPSSYPIISRNGDWIYFQSLACELMDGGERLGLVRYHRITGDMESAGVSMYPNYVRPEFAQLLGELSDDGTVAAFEAQMPGVPVPVQGQTTQVFAWFTPNAKFGAPLLDLRSSSEDLLLSWESSIGTYILEQTTQLGSAATWKRVETSPRLIGTRYELNLPSPAQSMFFRLREFIATAHGD